MAQLPPDGEILIQQNDGVVTIFNQYTQEEFLRFDSGDADASARAQASIHQDSRLTDEQKCFAHFWSGYFYAHAAGTASL